MSGIWPFMNGRLEEGQGKTYRAVTTIERWIPMLFAALHVVLCIMIILAIAGVIDWAK